MRVLYEPELSMRSYEDGKWLLDSDSQLNKMTQCMKQFPVDWEWDVMLPEPDQVRLSSTLVFPVDRTTLWEVPWAQNVQTNRFAFPMNHAVNILANARPDLILTETIEHAQNWRRALEHLNMKDVKIATITVLYDDWRDDAFMLRQVDGAISADYSFFSLSAIAQAWMDRTQKLVKSEEVVRTGVWNALFDPQEVWDAIGRINTPPHQKPVIFFTSRLSNEELYHSSTFFKAIRLMEPKGLDFEVWVANPNGARDVADVFLESDRITTVGTGPREEYLQMLIKSTVVPILYDQSTIHSLGYCEAIAARNVVVTQTPKSNSVPVPGLWIRDVNDPEEVAIALESALEAFKGGSQWDSFLAKQISEIESGRGIRTNLPHVQRTLENLI